MTDIEGPRLPVPLVDVLPNFAAELAEALRLENGVVLADQVRELSISAVCGCGDDFCASVYTGPRPDESWGAEHRNVTPTMAGMVILDVVADRIRFVEVLHRDDVKLIVAPLAQ